MDEKKVFKDRLTADDILREAASLAKEDMMFRQQQYEDRAKSIDQVFTVEPDAAFLQFARTYDQQHSEVQVKRKTTYVTKRFVRFAAIFLACFITMGSLTIGTSEALREKVFTLFFDNESGSVALRNEIEEEMIGGWKDYWYPTWLPEGFYMLGAREEEHLMVYISKNSDSKIRIKEYDLDTSVFLDTETAEIEEKTINDKKVILSIDETNKIMVAIWKSEKKVIEVSIENSIDKELLIKIVENMKLNLN